MAGATAALTWRLTPSLAIGAETEFYQVYNSLGFTGRIGSAAYVGPTLWAQITPKAFVSLAWSAQVASNLADASPSTLALYNQSYFARERVHLVVGVAF